MRTAAGALLVCVFQILALPEARLTKRAYMCRGADYQFRFNVEFSGTSATLTTSTGRRYRLVQAEGMAGESRWEGAAALFGIRGAEAWVNITDVVHRGCTEVRKSGGASANRK